MKRPPEGGVQELKDYREKEYRTVSIFGTGSEETVADEEAIEMSIKVADKLMALSASGDKIYRIATGGYEGVMEAVSQEAAKKAKEMGLDPKEVVRAFTLEVEELKKYEVPEEDTEIIRLQTPIERTAHLIDESDAGFIVIGGGFGTTNEIINTLQTKYFDSKFDTGKPARPLIIIDKSLKHSDLLTLLAQKEKKLQGQAIMDQVYIINGESEAPSLAAQIIETYSNQEANQESRAVFGQYSLGEFIRHRNEFEEGGGI